MATGTSLRPCFFPLLLIFATFTAGCGTKVIHYKLGHEYAVGDKAFPQTLGNILGPSLVAGNTITTLENGDEIFPAMLDAIRKAERTITLETYIYWSGTIGREFTDALAERARAGVRVHVMIDWLGSARIDRGYLDTMKAAGVEVAEYHPFHLIDPLSFRELDHRTHRKILVVDGKVGFTGGVGIADEWRGHAQDPDHWRDDHYRIEGPAVAQLQGVFMDNWMQTVGEVLHGEDYFPTLPKAGEEYAQVFKSSFQGGSGSMQLLFLLSIAAAEKDVRLASAYFVPDQTTTDCLLFARKRGVRVTIIVPGRHTDEKVVRRASRATWGPLLKAGVEIYEFQPTMYHCKQLIVDDLWSTIGSSNFDNRSFRLNDEANLNVYDRTFATGQIKLFDADKARSKRITYEMWQHRPLGEKLAERLSSLLAWEL